MRNPINELRAILDNSQPCRLFIPRGVFWFLALLTAGLHFSAFLLFSGIWIIVSVFLFMVSVLFIHLYYRVWITYYAPLSFILVMLVELVLMFAAAKAALFVIVRL
ncbi:MAG: hypothetical protein ACI3XM_01425 [Eubacteriales bacterium]